MGINLQPPYLLYLKFVHHLLKHMKMVKNDITCTVENSNTNCNVEHKIDTEFNP